MTADNGELTVYVDGVRPGGAQVPDAGVDGRATRELRFGADQGGGQLPVGAVDRVGNIPCARSETEVGDRRGRVFG